MVCLEKEPSPTFAPEATEIDVFVRFSTVNWL